MRIGVNPLMQQKYFEREEWQAAQVRGASLRSPPHDRYDGVSGHL
jgi:hypothetical protein